jgi:protein tyrosine phosphatase
VTRGEIILRVLSVAQAEDCRDAAAKALYHRLFAWIVSRADAFLSHRRGAAVSVTAFTELKVGVLDIFGFENFDVNSFEQLCINVANEQLQRYFNEHIFATELAELKAEGIAAPTIDYADNSLTLELFLKRQAGLFAILDEESYFPRGTDLSLTSKLHSGLKKKFVAYTAPKSGKDLQFTITHYAGPVSYHTEGFLEKNRDSLAQAIQALFQKSGNSVICTIFADDFEVYRSSTGGGQYGTPQSSPKKGKGGAQASPGGGINLSNRRSPTIGAHFKASLANLIGKMDAATPHFVRCIKTNTEKQPKLFTEPIVETQLKYAGVLQTVQIRRDGYPVRLEFQEFARRYGLIELVGAANAAKAGGAPADDGAVAAPAPKDDTARFRASCVTILARANLPPTSTNAGGATANNWELGTSMVFLKYFIVDGLSSLMQNYHRHAVTMQCAIRRFLACRAAEVKRIAAEKKRKEEQAAAEKKRKEEVAAALAKAEADRLAEERRLEAERVAAAEKAAAAAAATVAEAARLAAETAAAAAAATAAAADATAATATVTAAADKAAAEQQEMDLLSSSGFMAAGGIEDDDDYHNMNDLTPTDAPTKPAEGRKSDSEGESTLSKLKKRHSSGVDTAGDLTASRRTQSEAASAGELSDAGESTLSKLKKRHSKGVDVVATAAAAAAAVAPTSTGPDPAAVARRADRQKKRERNQKREVRREKQMQRDAEHAKVVANKAVEEAYRTKQRADEKIAAKQAKPELILHPMSAGAYDKLEQNFVGKDRIPAGVDHLNRYINILPNPRTRVRLDELEGEGETSRYINANFVQAYDGTPQAYIACQGPMPATLNAFWRMVWEKNVRSVVMVTGLKEKGVEKCARYWPTALYNHEEQCGDVQFGTVNVAIMAGYRKEGFITSKFRVKVGDEERDVHHFWYDSWPDHGVPKVTGPVVAMLKACREFSDEPDQPWVVHCSAGIGRTGSFIAVDHGLRQFETTGTVDVIDIVAKIRKDRGGMVQHPEQADFVHRTLNGYVVQNEVAEGHDTILRTTLKKAVLGTPKNTPVHPSQLDTHEGDVGVIPSWRQKEIDVKSARKRAIAEGRPLSDDEDEDAVAGDTDTVETANRAKRVARLDAKAAKANAAKAAAEALLATPDDDFLAQVSVLKVGQRRVSVRKGVVDDGVGGDDGLAKAHSSRSAQLRRQTTWYDPTATDDIVSSDEAITDSEDDTSGDDGAPLRRGQSRVNGNPTTVWAAPGSGSGGADGSAGPVLVEEEAEVGRNSPPADNLDTLDRVGGAVARMATDADTGKGDAPPPPQPNWWLTLAVLLLIGVEHGATLASNFVLLLKGSDASDSFGKGFNSASSNYAACMMVYGASAMLSVGLFDYVAGATSLRHVLLGVVLLQVIGSLLWLCVVKLTMVFFSRALSGIAFGAALSIAVYVPTAGAEPLVATTGHMAGESRGRVRWLGLVWSALLGGAVIGSVLSVAFESGPDGEKLPWHQGDDVDLHFKLVLPAGIVFVALLVVGMMIVCSCQCCSSRSRGADVAEVAEATTTPKRGALHAGLALVVTLLAQTIGSAVEHALPPVAIGYLAEDAPAGPGGVLAGALVGMWMLALVPVGLLVWQVRVLRKLPEVVVGCCTAACVGSLIQLAAKETTGSGAYIVGALLVHCSMSTAVFCYLMAAVHDGPHAAAFKLVLAASGGRVIAPLLAGAACDDGDGCKPPTQTAYLFIVLSACSLLAAGASLILSRRKVRKASLLVPIRPSIDRSGDGAGAGSAGDVGNGGDVPAAEEYDDHPELVDLSTAIINNNFC